MDSANLPLCIACIKAMSLNSCTLLFS